MASRRGVAKFLAKFQSRSVARKRGSGTVEGDSQSSEDHFRSHAHGRRDNSENLPREFCVPLSALLRIMLISTYTRNRKKVVLTFAWKNGHTDYTWQWYMYCMTQQKYITERNGMEWNGAVLCRFYENADTVQRKRFWNTFLTQTQIGAGLEV